MISEYRNGTVIINNRFLIFFAFDLTQLLVCRKFLIMPDGVK